MRIQAELAAFKASQGEQVNHEDELADAHRRAGQAEQRLAWEKDTTSKREEWLRKAKEEWGVSTSISFDVIWEACLALKKASLVKKEQVATVTISRELAERCLGYVNWRSG